MKIRLKQVIDLKPTSRVRTPQGFLICQGAKLAKPMVKEYYAGELGIVDGLEPTDTISIYTSPDVLFGDAVINGFTGSDVVMTHPKGNQLTSDNYKDHIIGTAKNVRSENGYLVADLWIKDRWAIDAIEYDDVKQISLGYAAELDMTAGTTDTGQTYQGQWVNMVADHVAIVREGRCGADCAIGDKQTVNNPNQPKEQSMKVTVNGIEFDVGDNAPLAQAINMQSQKLADLEKGELKIGDSAFNLTESKAVQATIDKLVADKAALADENATLKANQIKPEQIEQLVADRAKTIDDAKKLNPQIVADGKTVEAIKREIIAAKADEALVKAIVGDNVKDAEQVTIDTAFKALVATADSKPNIAADDVLANLNNVGDAKAETKTFDKTKMWETN